MTLSNSKSTVTAEQRPGWHSRGRTRRIDGGLTASLDLIIRSPRSLGPHRLGENRP